MKLIKSFLMLCSKNFIKYYCKIRFNSVFKTYKVKKVLIYAYTGLGNFVMYTPTIMALKKLIPQANFTLLHGNDTGCHEVVTGSNLFDNYIIVKRNASWKIRAEVIYKIRKENYDLIVSEFHNNNIFMACLTVLSGAKYRLGHVSSPGWKNYWDFIYNIPVKMLKNQHEIDRYLELAYVLGASKQNIVKSPFIQMDPGDIEFAKKFLASCGINSGCKIINVQPGTSPTMRWKQWDLDNYRKLCEKILKLSDVKVILHGSPNEVDMIKGMINKMKNKPIIAAGKTTVKQAAAIIKESDILICNDSGLMHIAVAVRTPVIAIYGPTDYTRTAPFGDKHTIVRNNLECSPCFQLDGDEKVKNCPYNYKCLTSLTVDDVFSIVKMKVISKSSISCGN